MLGEFKRNPRVLLDEEDAEMLFGADLSQIGEDLLDDDFFDLIDGAERWGLAPKTHKAG